MLIHPHEDHLMNRSFVLFVEMQQRNCVPSIIFSNYLNKNLQMTCVLQVFLSIIFNMDFFKFLKIAKCYLLRKKKFLLGMDVAESTCMV